MRTLTHDNAENVVRHYWLTLCAEALTGTRAGGTMAPNPEREAEVFDMLGGCELF